MAVFNSKKNLKDESDDTKKQTLKAKQKKDNKKPTSNKKSKSDKTKKEKPSTDASNSKKSGLKYLGGLLFAKMMRGGASELRANAEEVNKLNVFPVPDGDTGDNMRMTIESGIAALDSIDSDDLAEVMKVASKGMLLGARGNSGVILSQFFAGIAKGFESADKADAQSLGRALELGVEQAYTSVMTPTEGTILTVAREAVEYAVSRINSKSTVRTVFADLVKEMHSSLNRTPEILTILKDAGVVDSGGAGLFYIMDGLNRVLNGEEIEESLQRTSSQQANIDTSTFGPDSEMTYGYCTELLVQLQSKKTDIDSFDVDALKTFLSDIGDSIVAFKTDSIVKIHVHTLTPEKVLAHMRKFGEFITVKIENMSIQHTETVGNDILESEPVTPALPKKPYAIVAVSNGPGIDALFRELGCDEIVPGGQTNNPSTNDFIDAFKRINADDIYVFPNNGNIIMSATQAADIYESARVHIIPTKNIGAGYVALSSMSFEIGSPDELVKGAVNAVEKTVSAYISPAVRDANMNGIQINDGDTIAICGKEILVAESTRQSAAHSLAQKLLSSGDRFMLTVFCGSDTSIAECTELESYVAENFPDVEAYFIDGGQDIYPYIFVAE